MTEVNIYITVMAKGIRPAEGLWSYILETEVRGRIITRKGFGRVQQATENILTLEALGHALKRMKKSSSIRVFSGNSYLLGAIGKGWMEEWAKNGWRNAAGRPVKNVDLWQKIYDFSREQKLDVEENREHPYHSWQLTQLKRLEKVDFTLWEEGFDKPGGPFEVNDIRTVAI